MEEEIQQSWDGVISALRKLPEAITETMVAFGCVAETTLRALKPILDEFAVWLERERRARLFALLPLWIPDRVREWIADNCPERWLPRIDFDDGGKVFWRVLWERCCRKGER